MPLNIKRLSPETLKRDSLRVGVVDYLLAAKCHFELAKASKDLYCVQSLMRLCSKDNRHQIQLKETSKLHEIYFK